jgi:ABC-type transport system involved in multi-copper enzyme maturation permease subunit
MNSPRIISAIIGQTFKESIRAKWLIMFTIVYFLVTINVPFLVLIIERLLPPSTLNSYLVYLGTTSYPFLPLLSLPLGALSIVEEKESGTLQYLLANPMSRMQFLAGRFIGLTISTSMVLVAGYAIAALVAFNVKTSVLTGLAFIVGLSLGLNIIMLAVAITISTMSKRKVTALSVAIFLWFLLVLISDFGGSFGVIVSIANGTKIALISALLNPIEAAGLISEIHLNAYGSELAMTGEIIQNAFGVANGLYIMSLSLVLWGVLAIGLMILLFKYLDLV